MPSEALQAEIVRCQQKDEYYLYFMRGCMADIIQSLLGMCLIRSFVKLSAVLVIITLMLN